MTAVFRDTSTSTWEEIELTLGRESTMTVPKVVVMGLVGVVAAAGVLTGALHVVVGAMVIAPGFEPLVRIALGLVQRRGSWRDGLVDSARGYGALLLGAAACAALLSASGTRLPRAARPTTPAPLSCLAGPPRRRHRSSSVLLRAWVASCSLSPAGRADRWCDDRAGPRAGAHDRRGLGRLSGSRPAGQSCGPLARRRRRGRRSLRRRARASPMGRPQPPVVTPSPPGGGHRTGAGCIIWAIRRSPMRLCPDVR